MCTLLSPSFHEICPEFLLKPSGNPRSVVIMHSYRWCNSGELIIQVFQKFYSQNGKCKLLRTCREKPSPAVDANLLISFPYNATPTCKRTLWEAVLGQYNVCSVFNFRYRNREKITITFQTYLIILPFTWRFSQLVNSQRHL